MEKVEVDGGVAGFFGVRSSEFTPTTIVYHFKLTGDCLEAEKIKLKLK